MAGIGAVGTGLATTGLAAFALRGLRSLTMTRDEIIHRTARDARLQAIHQLEELANKIIPMNMGVLEALAQCKAGVYLQPGESPKFDPDPRELSRVRIWLKSLTPDAYTRIAVFLNHLEAWSVYSTEVAADSKVAMGPAAPLLRAWVGQYYAVLLVLRSGDGPVSGKFPNLVKLYTAWSAAMDAEQLALDHQEIIGQLEQAKERLSRAKLPDVTPKFGD